MFDEAKRVITDAAILVVGGAVLGALTGTVCLVLLSISDMSEWPAGYLSFPLFMGSLVGAPLGALSAPILGRFVLRRVPVGRAVLCTPLGTLAGSFVALLLGWLFADISDGRGIFYLISGALVGLVLTAFVLKAQFGDRRGKTA